MPKHELNFLEFLQSFRGGRLLAELDEGLTEVVSGINETGLSGSLTLKLPLKRNKSGQIEITPEVNAKVPRRPMQTGIYWGTTEGSLSRRDPDQMDIEDEIERRRAVAGD